MSRSPLKRYGGWLSLLRPPNLLTVPGDPIAGAMLAVLGGAEFSFLYMLPTVGAALLLYMGGLIGNDCFDYREDAKTRPTRPLPSGSVSRRSAMVAAAVFTLAGIGVASSAGLPACIVSVLLATAVWSYNGLTKKFSFLGSLNMGICRGLSLLLGATGVGWMPRDPDVVLIGCVGLILYVGAVTLLAERETEQVRIPIRRWLPAAVNLVTMGSIVLLSGSWNYAFILLAASAVAWPIVLGVRLGIAPPPAGIVPSIGGFIRGLLLLQAAFSALLWPTGAVVACVILLAWPVNVYLARQFYAS